MIDDPVCHRKGLLCRLPVTVTEEAGAIARPRQSKWPQVLPQPLLPARRSTALAVWASGAALAGGQKWLAINPRQH
jgi:hypothetical protein